MAKQYDIEWPPTLTEVQGVSNSITQQVLKNTNSAFQNSQ